jgi:plastocyanin
LRRYSILLPLALLVAVPAGAGTVCGTLRVPTGRGTGHHLNAYPGQAGSMPGAHGAASSVGDAVIYVATLPARADSALPTPPTARLAQKGQAFQPRVVVVPRGGAVDFPNLDPIFHNVFSMSPVRRFDLGKYPRGQSRRVTFPKPGVVGVFCDLHSNMSAFVLVVPNRAFARPADDGRWCLPALPPGRHEIVVWHPDHGERRHEVTVPERGEITLDAGF